MAEVPFQLQVVDAQGVIVRTRAGGKQEADLVELFVTSIMARGVGMFRSNAHVEQDIRAGIRDAMFGLKVSNPFDVIP